MRKFKRRQLGPAQQHTTVKKNGEVVLDDRKTDWEHFDISPGPAEVGVTLGVKPWRLGEDKGMSIESTCFIKLSCGQSVAEIEVANESAAHLAHKFLARNLNKYLREYLEGKKK